MSGVGIKGFEHLSDASAKAREVFLKYPPDHLVDYCGVAVDESVAKGDDRSLLRNPFGELRGQPRQLHNRFAQDCQLSLDG